MGDVPPSNPLVDAYRRHGLTWFPEAGFGYFECVGAPYDQEYFDRYAAQGETEIGKALNRFRCEIVARYWGGEILDVGVGSGAFLQAREASTRPDLAAADRGFDINPAGVAWLGSVGKFGELYQAGAWDAVTFWDSLEHIRRPDEALARVGLMAFVSIPIFDGPDHVLRSKHFRRDEHYFYFTRAGFLAWTKAQGFECLDVRATESAIGREGIETFVLRRII